ncbi:hypothetical protein CHELA1G11_13232 [Hyphomicrobiales bacterium]|nr:hypothetical protein CHELA1G11_13232 [Hyphomicrobiales bacterium]
MLYPWRLAGLFVQCEIIARPVTSATATPGKNIQKIAAWLKVASSGPLV